MANEINIQASLTFQRFIPLLQGSGNLNINQTATHGIFNVQNVGTTAEQLTGVDVVTLGYLFVKNLDATNFVQLATDNTFSATSTFAKLRPDRKSTRLNSSHVSTSYAVFCLKKKRSRRSSCPRSRLSGAI